MLGFFPLLLTDSDWALFVRHLAPGTNRARTVHVREASPLAFSWARLLSRLDRFERLTFAPSAADGTPPLIEVEEPATGRKSTGAVAFAEVLGALPCGAPIAWVLERRPLRFAGDLVARTVARREATFVKWLRLVPADAGAARARSTRGPSPARILVGRILGLAREVHEPVARRKQRHPSAIQASPAQVDHADHLVSAAHAGLANVFARRADRRTAALR
jgi:hypothetical protein